MADEKIILMDKMKKNEKYINQKEFWEQAGEIGYAKAQFASEAVEDHVMTRHRQIAINVARGLGVQADSRIIELGCGDGSFAERFLSLHFKHIDAFDKSGAAIKRAQTQSKVQNVSYYAEDIAAYDYEENVRWDGAFLMGFLHHVKMFAPDIISRLAKVCPNVIVVEPNGDNVIRKSFELMPSYRRAGEDSFRLKQLMNIFTSNGYELKMLQRVTIMPPFIPNKLFKPLKKLERLVEAAPVLDRICSTYILGFKQSSF